MTQAPAFTRAYNEPPRAAATPHPKHDLRLAGDYGTPTTEESYKVGVLWERANG